MATINDFGIPIPGGSSGILQPKLTNKWRVLFNNIGALADNRSLSVQAIEVNRPTLSWDEVELHRYNSRAWVAGKYNWAESAMIIEDDITSAASKIIQAQLQRQQFIIGVEGPFLAAAVDGHTYKFSMEVDMLDGGENILESWFYEGCWIKEANYNNLAYAETNTTVKINLSVRFDHAYQRFFATSGSQALGGPAVGTV
jgi:hypothetical protein